MMSAPVMNVFKENSLLRIKMIRSQS